MQYFSSERLSRLAIGMLVVCTAVPLPAYGAGGAVVKHGTSAPIALAVGLAFAVVLFSLLAILIAEIGQLIAYNLIGWDIYLLRVGPFLVRVKPFAMRLGFFPGQNTGWILAVPPSPEKWTNRRDTIVKQAGITANLICAAAAAVIFVAAPHARLLVFFVVPTGLFSLVLAMGSWLPGNANKARLRDREKVNASLSGRQTITRFGVARMKGIALYACGIAPEQWDAGLVSTLESGTESGVGETDAELRSANIFLYERYFDLREFEKARAALDRAILRTRPSERMWDGSCAEDAFFSAFIERNIERAQEALAKVESAKARSGYAYRRALAAIAIVRGDRTEALRLLKRGPYLGLFSDPFLRPRGRRMHAMVVNEAQRLAQ